MRPMKMPRLLLITLVQGLGLIKVAILWITSSSVFSILIITNTFAQSVAVTMTVDNNPIPVGGATALHVYAQILPSQQTNSLQIFSWYIDLLNTDNTIASANYSTLQKPASDNDLFISSTGATSGADRVGIYDTFLELPGAGKDTKVELLSVPISGVKLGHATFRVRAGSGVPNLEHDFIVAMSGDQDPVFGGDYTTAQIQLEVVSNDCTTRISDLKLLSLVGGTNLITIQFPLCQGFNHSVEHASELGTNTVWQALPGAPHNTGSVTDTNNVSRRFYRVHAFPPGS